MFIPQNISEFLDNPMGKGSSVIMNRAQVKEYLNQKYAMLIDKFGDFKVTVYTHNNSYYYHIIIPSESQRRNTYDVVVQFVNSDDPKEDFSNDGNLMRHHIKLFSNCPSFTYTYAYVYSEYDKMVDVLQTKFSDTVLTNPPTQRNPGEISSFEKSTYYACKFLKEHRTLLTKLYIGKNASPAIKTLVKNVRNSDTIMKEIAKEDERVKREGGNEGYVKLRKKTIKGSVMNTKPIKTAGVDKSTPAKTALKNKRKAEGTTSVVQPKKNATNVIKPKKNHTNVVKPKSKSTATRSTKKKK